MRLSRRNLLRLGTLGAARLGAMGASSALNGFLPPLPRLPVIDGKEASPAARRPIKAFGRAISYGIYVFQEPHLYARVVDVMDADEVRPIFAEIESDDGSYYNKRWYEVEGGYVYSKLIHVVPWEYNPSVTSAGADGFWAEVTVPFTDARVGPSLAMARTKYRYYGGTCYKVVKAVPGPGADRRGPSDPEPAFDYDWWYQIEDESFPGLYFVPARHLRQIPQAEYATLSPDVDPRDKRIDVRLADKRVLAYEKNRVVYECKCASGAKFSGDKDFRTPPGAYRVFRKTIGQHMHGGAFGDDDYFDLPGIPWVSYFTTTGIAFHGAYWHNDFGSERSHGCINLMDSDARWIWRWTTPKSIVNERYTYTTEYGEGTLVNVIGVNA